MNVLHSINLYLDFFWRSKFRLILVITYSIIVVFYVLFFVRIVEREPKLTKYKKTFYELSDKCLSGKDASSVNANDLRIIFNSIDRESGGVLLKYGFVSLLEDYIVHIRTDYDKENDKFYNAFAVILENEKKQEPYSRLSPEESRLLINLESSIRNNDLQTALFNLSSLSDILRISNENLDKLEKQNKWSIPLAIVGLIITLLFGIISIIKSLQHKKTSEKEEIEAVTRLRPTGDKE